MTTKAAAGAGVVLAAGILAALLMRGPSGGPEGESLAGPEARPILVASPTLATRRVPPATAQAAPSPVPREPTPAEGRTDRRATIDKSTREYLDSMTVPLKVLEEARALDVSEEVLRSMYAAELLLHYGGDTTADDALRAATEEAVGALSRSGDAGYRAVVANLLGNPTNTSRGDALAKATWRPGLEGPLLDRLRNLPQGVAAMAPLRALGGMDSPAVRAYLKEALRVHRDHASNFASAAGALGALHEGGVAETIGEKLSDRNWSGLHALLLDSIGRTGGDDAKRVLTAYLRDPAGELESYAVRALARVDPAAARAEAEAIVRGDSPNKATATELASLKAFLAER